MSKEAKTIYDKPKTTTNQLADIICWLEEGDIVVIKNDYGKNYIFHNGCSDGKNLTDHRIVMINCVSLPSLLNEGEWELYIRESGNKICECDNIVPKLNEIVANKEDYHNIFLFQS